MSKKYILQIHEGEVPLTQEATSRIIKAIKDEHLREIANSTYNTNELPTRCDNKSHMLYRKCVGGGICLARKYKRLFSHPDQVCSTCQSQGLVDTLNYLFSVYYEEDYRAEWRTPRRTKRSKSTRKEVKESTSGKTVKEQQIETLNNIEDKKIQKTVPDFKRKEITKVSQHPETRERKIVRGRNRSKHAEAI